METLALDDMVKIRGHNVDQNNNTKQCDPVLAVVCIKNLYHSVL